MTDYNHLFSLSRDELQRRVPYTTTTTPVESLRMFAARSEAIAAVGLETVRATPVYWNPKAWKGDKAPRIVSSAAPRPRPAAPAVKKPSKPAPKSKPATKKPAKPAAEARELARKSIERAKATAHATGNAELLAEATALEVELGLGDTSHRKAMDAAMGLAPARPSVERNGTRVTFNLPGSR